MKTTIQTAAALLGSRGGSRKVPKGLAVISKRRRREIVAMATAARIRKAEERRAARESKNS